jgi:hypothetical protein
MVDSIATVSRFLRAIKRRALDGDVGLAELTAVASLTVELRQTIDALVDVLLDQDDASYQEIAIALGITRQAAFKRYPGQSARPAGGQPSNLR